MARIARVVIPNIPHHIIQRGNRRQPDCKAYLGDGKFISLLEDICDRVLHRQKPGPKEQRGNN